MQAQEEEEEEEEGDGEREMMMREQDELGRERDEREEEEEEEGMWEIGEEEYARLGGAGAEGGEGGEEVVRDEEMQGAFSFSLALAWACAFGSRGLVQYRERGKVGAREGGLRKSQVASSASSNRPEHPSKARLINTTNSFRLFVPPQESNTTTTPPPLYSLPRLFLLPPQLQQWPVQDPAPPPTPKLTPILSLILILESTLSQSNFPIISPNSISTRSLKRRIRSRTRIRRRGT